MCELVSKFAIATIKDFSISFVYSKAFNLSTMLD